MHHGTVLSDVVNVVIPRPLAQLWNVAWQVNVTHIDLRPGACDTGAVFVNFPSFCFKSWNKSSRNARAPRPMVPNTPKITGRLAGYRTQSCNSSNQNITQRISSFKKNYNKEKQRATWFLPLVV